MNREKLTEKEFKDKFLYLDKTFVNKNLCYYLNRFKEDFDLESLNKSVKNIFPYINGIDLVYFINTVYNSNIEFSNRINLLLNKSLFYDYIKTLSDDKIKVDLIRLNFTKNFIYQCNGKIKSHSKLHNIDTKHLDYIDLSNIYYYNINQIQNKDEFLDYILNHKNNFFKYLIHQDIHNSIINPIIVSIMLSKYKGDKNNSSIIQLRDIRQIYKFVNKNKTKIEMIYFIKKFFIIDYDKSDTPIEKKIDPYLIIKFDFEILDNQIKIDITF